MDLAVRWVLDQPGIMRRCEARAIPETGGVAGALDWNLDARCARGDRSDLRHDRQSDWSEFMAPPEETPSPPRYMKLPIC